MQNDYVAPVDHGVLSSAGSVATGAVGGAAKFFGKTMMWVVGGAALVGFLWGGGFLAAAGSLLAGTTSAAGGVWATALSQIGMWGGFGGAVGMGLVGTIVGSFTSAFTSIYGAGKGALDAKDRVSMEKGQARAMEMQLEAYRSMAASNDNKYNLPQQGSRMNPAMSQIDASSVDRSGTMVGQQLARA